MNITREYTRFLLKTGYEDIPPHEIDRFKIRMIDSIGVIAAGTHAGAIEGCLGMFKGIGGTPEATVLFHGVRLPADKASLMNSLMMRSFDFEPVGGEFEDRTTGAAHISGSTIPCMLACGELAHASGKDAIAALILGDNLVARLQQGTGFAFDKGWDNTGTFNGLGATAVAAKLLGLDEDHCVSAFGIDINPLGSSMDGVKDGVLAFKLPHGLSGMNAIMSARMAQVGFTGTRDAIGGRHGYFNLFGNDGMDPSTVLKDLGKYYYSDGDIKPWPACRITHGPIQSILGLVKEHSFSSQDVDKIVVTLQEGNGSLVDIPFEPVVEAPNFNLRFLLALALVKGAVIPQYFEDEYQLDPEINRVAKNLIDVVYDPHMKDLFSANVEVTLKDGTTYSNYVVQPKGNLVVDPLTREELLDKYYTNMQYSGLVTREHADKILEAIEHFEDFDDVNDFVALLS
ncbi:MAG: MmgE/PrpD family protein [Coriobacteriales bacterium]|jgi:2-methylcitrate dehydratase PrpD|nr:MmgE/PrpD family protein [Coriobacteriales bacterium]